jgi:dTDP-4-amino-4,6-dideoxygalactose transaminase
MIRFSKSSITELEEKYIVDALYNNILSGDGKYTGLVYEQFRKLFGIENMLLTTSGTAALEMAALLIDIQPGDEVIVPSFTFSSTVNAFLLRGAKPIFCDIRKDTMNLDESLLEDLITTKTRAIYPIHYAGVPCEMDVINDVANRHGLFVIEDAAQAVGSYYKGKAAGTLSEFGCFSFHETKNYIMGEGGAITINEEKYLERAEIIREKGTNRRNFLKGSVDKYTWHDIGSSFLPSDILAALLCAQMERFEEITNKRMNVWEAYQIGLKSLEESEKLILPKIPDYITHNAHMFNILLPSEEVRSKLISILKEKEVYAYICYVPLHSSPMGRNLGYEPEMLPVTEDYGSRVLRLPLHVNMSIDDAEFVVEQIKENL